MPTQALQSPKLGKIEYNEEDVITLSAPMLGFPELNDFLLISDDKTFPFLWFQSIEDTNICFILIEPEMFFQDYQPKLRKRELKVLGVEEKEHLKVFGIVVVADDPQQATVNLRAPLMINFQTKLAKQTILDDDKWQIKTPIFQQG